MQVEWRVQEEEEEAQQQQAGGEPAPEPEERPRAQRPWWWTALLGLLLIGAIAWGVRFVLQRQLDAVSAAAEAEVMAIHDIVQRAERNGDETLFGSMISPEYPNWGSIQRRAFRNGQRWNRKFFGLSYAGDGTDALPTGTVTGVDFTSDWRMATVQLAIPYTPHEPGQAESAPVLLEQTVTYREESIGWALVPAYPAFWGEERKTRGDFVTVTFPQRDAEIVEALLAEWDELLARACQELADLNCLRGWQLDVELSTESSVLAGMNDPIRWLEDGPVLTLPTPSVIGRPVDAAGMEAMQAGYAPLILAAGIGDVTGWDCCEKAVFARALLDKQLAELGVGRWPITPDAYAQMLQGPLLDVSGLHRVYLQRSVRNVSEQSRRTVYSLIDFLLATQPELSAARLLRNLDRFDTYRAWLSDIGFGGDGLAMQKAWIRYANGQLSAQAAADPLPPQDIQLLCAPERSRNTDVYRYDFSTGTFAPELTNRSFRLMYPLPGDDGVLLQERSQPVNGSSVQLWRAGQLQDVAYRPYSGSLFPVDTSGEEMLFYSYDTRQQVVLFNSLSLAACEDGSCAIRFYDGYPVWSPDRQRTVVSRGTGVLWLGDADGQADAAIGRGASALWLDNDRFAFIQLEEPARVVAVTLPQLETETLLNVDALIGALDLDINFEFIFINGLGMHPSRPDQLFVVARIQRTERSESDEYHIFSLDLTAEASDAAALTYLMQVNHSLEPFRPLRFSPDGRWLVMRTVERGSNGWHLNLYDLESGRHLAYSSEFPLAFPGYDWSGDGSWLVRVEDGFLHLIAPGLGVQKLVVHDFSNCYAAAWVNRQE